MNRVSAPFIARTVSHCQDYLKVKWADGLISSFPSTFLRANVRDATFFDESSLLHLPAEHNEFLHKSAPITQADQLDSNEIKVSWTDHSSIFNIPWLRAQDEDNLPSLVSNNRRLPWESSFKPIDYDYSEASPKLSSWMDDVEKHGCVLFHNVPPSLEGFKSVVNLIGPLSQRRHPTNDFSLQVNPKMLKVDVASYSSAVLPVHTDQSYYTMPSPYISLLSLKYSALQNDTESILINSFQVAEQLRAEEPEAFELLSTIKVRQVRRRLGVEEECDPTEVSKYEWDFILDKPIINLDEHGQVAKIRLHLASHFGHPLVTKNKDEKLLRKFYQAHEKFLQMCSNPQNYTKFVLREGMLIFFDNHKLIHGRGHIYPDTNRYLVGGYTSGESWTSRRRLCLGKRTGLAGKWLVGCSEKALVALAERFEKTDRESYA